jgi:hypothetical protein
LRLQQGQQTVRLQEPRHTGHRLQLLQHLRVRRRLLWHLAARLGQQAQATYPPLQLQQGLRHQQLLRHLLRLQLVLVVVPLLRLLLLRLLLVPRSLLRLRQQLLAMVQQQLRQLYRMRE